MCIMFCRGLLGSVGQWRQGWCSCMSPVCFFPAFFSSFFYFALLRSHQFSREYILALVILLINITFAFGKWGYSSRISTYKLILDISLFLQVVLAMKASPHFVLYFIFHHISNPRCLYKILGLKKNKTPHFIIFHLNEHQLTHLHK